MRRPLVNSNSFAQKSEEKRTLRRKSTIKSNLDSNEEKTYISKQKITENIAGNEQNGGEKNLNRLKKIGSERSKNYIKDKAELMNSTQILKQKISELKVKMSKNVYKKDQAKNRNHSP